MPQYRKYTTCVKPTDFTPPPFLGSFAVGATWLIVIAAIVSPLELLAVPGWLPVVIGLVLALIAACNWYLHRRLICLGTRFSCADGPMPDNQECVKIIRAMVELAKSLGMDTTAEGIEAPEQLAQLKALGCAEGQGFLFSQARPVGDVPDMLARGGAIERAA